MYGGVVRNGGTVAEWELVVVVNRTRLIFEPKEGKRVKLNWLR